MTRIRPAPGHWAWRATNLLNAWRSEGRRNALAVRIAESEATDAVTREAALVIALRVDLARAWRHLRPLEQEAIALTARDGLTGQQAADLLGISHTAYRIRLSRARRTLRHHLDQPSSAPASRARPQEGIAR